MARLEGIEPPTYGLEIRCSIQLSYRRSAVTGSDPRASRCARSGSTRHGAAPGQLRSPVQPPAAGRKLVGARGFEPPTPCSQSRCATGLRHAPMKLGGESAEKDRKALARPSNADPRSSRSVFRGPEALSAHSSRLYTVPALEPPPSRPRPQGPLRKES